MGIMESISDLLCPLAFVTWNKTYVTDKESDYAEWDLDSESDGLVTDHNPSSS